MSANLQLDPIVDFWSEAILAEELRSDAEFAYVKLLMDPVILPTSSRHYIKAVKIWDYLSTQYGYILSSSPWIVPIYGIEWLSKPVQGWGEDDINEFWNQRECDPNHQKLKSALQVEKFSAEWKKEVEDWAECLERSYKSSEQFHPIRKIQRRCREAQIQLSKVFKEEILDECPICRDPLIDSSKNMENTRQTLPTPDNLARIPVSKELTSKTCESVGNCFHAITSHYSTYLEGERQILDELASFVWELTKAHLRYKMLQQSIPRACAHPVKTKCGHIFGLRCIYSWIQENGLDTTCPNCRTKLAGAQNEEN